MTNILSNVNYYKGKLVMVMTYRNAKTLLFKQLLLFNLFFLFRQSFDAKLRATFQNFLRNFFYKFRATFRFFERNFLVGTV